MTPNALYWDPDQLPPLRLKHGEVCGEILSLAYTFMGDELEIAARIDHPEAARMPAFSVAFTPCAYEVQALHVRVLSARLDEVSLTDKPCLSTALVTRRCPTSAVGEAPAAYRALAAQFDRMRLLLAA